jgi:hypothetical protein
MQAGVSTTITLTENPLNYQAGSNKRKSRIGKRPLFIPILFFASVFYKKKK